MKNKNKSSEGKGIKYIDFIMSGGEVFPKDLYPVKKTRFGKIKFYPKYQIIWD